MTTKKKMPAATRDKRLSALAKVLMCENKCAILELCLTQRLGIADIARSLGISLALCAWHVTDLKKYEYVTTEQDPYDKRATIVRTRRIKVVLTILESRKNLLAAIESGT